GEMSFAARTSRQLSQGSRVPSRTFQRGGCVSHHRAELEHRNADDRLDQVSKRDGVSRADEEAPGGGKSARRGVRALQGGNGAPQGSGVSLVSRTRCSAQ